MRFNIYKLPLNILALFLTMIAILFGLNQHIYCLLAQTVRFRNPRLHFQREKKNEDCSIRNPYYREQRSLQTGFKLTVKQHLPYSLNIKDDYKVYFGDHYKKVTLGRKKRDNKSLDFNEFNSISGADLHNSQSTIIVNETMSFILW